MGMKKNTIRIENKKHAIFMKLVNACSRVDLQANWWSFSIVLAEVGVYVLAVWQGIELLKIQSVAYFYLGSQKFNNLCTSCFSQSW